MRILSVVGARPNFMKIAPIVRAVRAAGGFDHRLVHTGQHYDAIMSDAFFRALELPEPDFNLGVGSGSHAEQTGRVMMLMEPLLADLRPDLTLVVGDVNSTLAAALTSKKLGLAVAHVEAGLRSGDMAMPEEINRICTDAISDLLFTTERQADENLLREGVAGERIRFVGNVMIDTLLTHRDAALALAHHERLGLSPGRFATMTLHRPSNVEDPDRLAEILAAVREGMEGMPVVFPIHPRTRARVEAFGLSHLLGKKAGLIPVDPLGYLEFLSLNAGAALVLTDSGGLQEETTILGVPCITLRENTERPVTVTHGTNRLAGVRREGVVAAIREVLEGRRPQAQVPERWDGQAAQRIVAEIKRFGA